VTQTRGFAPQRGEFFVKRVVAVAGDELEIVHGAVFRNGKREEPYATGTPVGVTRDEDRRVFSVFVFKRIRIRLPKGRV
jgi:type IV secretory pathway protease TraF